jgi:hypothetical protein
MKEIGERERALLRTRGGERGRRLDQAFAALDETDAALARLHGAIDREAERQIEDLTRQVRTERERVKLYRTELVSLNSEAEEVVGGVTQKNFSNVRKKFHQLILRADVGIIDVAWMRKEEHKARGTSLNKDRLAEIQNLDSEFSEVKEVEGVEPEAEGGADESE